MTAMVRMLLVLGLVSAVAVVDASATGAPPEGIPLPNGFAPEGIVFGKGSTFFVGSPASGAVFRGDAATGEGELLVSSPGLGSAWGLGFERRTSRLFVAGGPTGGAAVYETSSGEELAVVQLTTEPSFVNDVDVARSAAWFTDSLRPVLYRMSLDDPTEVEEVPLGGDFVFDPGGFNANGIVALRGGRALLIVHYGRGELYTVDPDTGDATLVDLSGEAVENGDGLVAVGRDVYVVQNTNNQISVVRLDRDLERGEVRRVITSERFRVPTTADLFDRHLYVVNARFGTPVGPEVDYDVVRVRR
ncbi:MAG: hypothetical protein ACRDZ1_05365 [Acidimicrobiia bacterium]